MTSSTDLPSPTSISPTDVPSPTFSTLEVDHRASYNCHPVQGLIAITSQDEGLPQAVKSHSPEHHNSENDTSAGHVDEKPRRFTKLLTRTKGFLILGVLLVVLGAVLGGVFGTRTSHHDIKTPSVGPSEGNATANSGPSPTDSRNVNILPNSNISATVFFWQEHGDKNETTHHLVVFQDYSGAMIACMRNSTTKIWATRNLTAATEDSVPINAIYGSPLASAALFTRDSAHAEINVWYLHPDGTLGNVYWGRNFKDEAVYTRQELTSPSRNPGSNIAVSRRPTIDYSRKGFDLVYLAQQTYADQIMITTITRNREDTKNYLYALEMQNPSHLDLWPPNQKINYTTDYMAMSFESNGKWMETYYYPDAGNLSFKVLNTLSDYRASPQDVKQLFTMPFKDYTHQNLYLVLLSNGSFLGSRDKFFLYPMTISGGPATKFTSIATTDDSRLYGISGDEVLEYAFNKDQNASSNFTYVGRVYP